MAGGSTRTKHAGGGGGGGGRSRTSARPGQGQGGETGHAAAKPQASSGYRLALGAGLVALAAGVVAALQRVGGGSGAGGGSPATAAAEAAALPALLAGDCGLGSLERPGEVQRLGLAALGGSRLPGGLRCPIVVRDLEQGLPPGAWKAAARWGDLQEIQNHAAPLVVFDSSPVASFAYWDNNSLLSAAAREVGVLRQGYTKVTAKTAAFLDAARRGSSPFGFVRYLDDLRTLVPIADAELGTALTAIFPTGAAKDRVTSTLVVSGVGTYSTAHYDNWENVLVMLGGEKEAFLSPPDDYPFFEVYPGSHPHARQGRRHFGRTGDQRPVGARVLQTTVRRGEALVIPAGWFHHLVSPASSVAAALHVLPDEFYHFNDWMLGNPAGVLPFYRMGDSYWATPRVAAAMRAFVPALLTRLGFAAPSGDQGSGGGGAAAATADPLRIFVRAAYGVASRKELGIRKTKRDCGKPPSEEDRRFAEAAAEEVAERFRTHFRKDVLLTYLMPYLETVLSKVGGKGRNAQEILGATVAFVQDCLLSG